MLNDIFFVGLSILALVGAVGLVVNRNPLYCVLYTVLNFFCIGGLFLTLHSEFLAVTQIIVYAGAIMVLFLFIIMLLNLNFAESSESLFDWRKGLGFILGLAFLGELLYALTAVKQWNVQLSPTFAHGKVEPIGKAMMTGYVFPFEMISVILLAALIGAILIAKKHKA